jgi:hypothetical protein
MNYKIKSGIRHQASGALWILILGMSLFCLMPLRGASDQPKDNKPDDIDKIIDDLDKELKPVPVEEEVDPITILNKVVDKMESAEDRLSSASNTPVNVEGADAEQAKKRQQQAIDEINKLFRQITKLQTDATDGIDKVIRTARVYQSEGQGQGQQQKPKPGQKPQGKKPKPKPKDDGKDPGSGPAPRAYDDKGQLPNGFTTRRSDGLKWGNLPPKLRDEIIQSAQEEFLPEYQERLMRYFKILAGQQ